MQLLDTKGPIVAKLREFGTAATVKKGHVLAQRGEAGTHLVVIDEGTAEVSVVTALGKLSILGQVGPGDIVGEIACLDGGQRSADVTAQTAMKIVTVPRRDVMQVLTTNPDFAQLVIAQLCKTARNASDMFEIHSMSDAAARLATSILRLNDREAGTETVVPLAISQSWLGDFAGLSRENVNRYLRKWAELKITNFADGALTIQDRQRLEDIATQGARS